MTIRKFKKVENRLMKRRKDYDKTLMGKSGFKRPGSMKRK